MKRKSILGVFFVTAIVAGLICIGQVSAQKRTSDVQTIKNEARPETTAAPESIQVEDFTYALGQLTDINGGANVSGGNWVNFSGTGFPLTVASGSLTFAGYPSSGVGNKINTVNGSAEDAYRQFTAQGVGTTTYAAFMVNVTNVTGMVANTSTTGDYFAGFLPSNSTTALNARVSVRVGSVATKYQFGLRATSANTASVFSTTDLDPGTTYLVVISYQQVAGDTNDIIKMWINPTLGGAEPAADLTQTTATVTDNIDVSRFFIRQGTNAVNSSVDGIRVSNTWASLITPAPVVRANADFNGDGKTDWAISRNSGGLKTWWIQNNGSAGSNVAQFGITTDKVVPADFDGDGKTDIAVWREAPATQAAFYIFQSSTGTVRTELFGQTGDQPTTVGDYDGDGKADVSVFRPGASAGAQSFFFYRGSLSNPSGNVTYLPWGTFGDAQTSGDFDGDGKFDVCVRRNGGGGQGLFILRRSSDSGVEYINWGLTTDGIIPGDYDGDGKSDFFLVRFVGNAANGYLLERDGGGTGASPIVFGLNTDIGAFGDYDGDGKQDVAVWRPNADATQNFFWVRQSSTGVVITFEWGQGGDEPVAVWNATGFTN